MRGSLSQLSELKRSLLGSPQPRVSDLLDKGRQSSTKGTMSVSREKISMAEVMQAQHRNRTAFHAQTRTKSVESLKNVSAQFHGVSRTSLTDSKKPRDSGLPLNFKHQTKKTPGISFETGFLRDRAASASLDVLRLDLNAAKFNSLVSSARDSQLQHKLALSNRTDGSRSFDTGKGLGFSTSRKVELFEGSKPSLSGKLDSFVKSVTKKPTSILFGNGLLSSSVSKSKGGLVQTDHNLTTKRGVMFDGQPSTIDSILDGWRNKPLAKNPRQLPSSQLNTWRTEEKRQQTGWFRDGLASFKNKETGILLSNRDQRDLKAPTTMAQAGDDLAAAYTTGSSVPTVSFREDLVSPVIGSNLNPLKNYFSFKNGKNAPKEDFSKKLVLGNLNLNSLNEASHQSAKGFSSAQLKFSSTTERAESRAAGTGLCLSSRDRSSGANNPYDLDSLRTSTRPTAELLQHNKQLFDFKKDQLRSNHGQGQLQFN